MRGSVIWAGFPHLEKTQERILVALEVVGNSVEGWFLAFPRDDNEPVGTCSLDKPLLPLPLGHKAVVQVFFINEKKLIILEYFVAWHIFGGMAHFWWHGTFLVAWHIFGGMPHFWWHGTWWHATFLVACHIFGGMPHFGWHATSFFFFTTFYNNLHIGFWWPGQRGGDEMVGGPHL